MAKRIPTATASVHAPGYRHKKTAAMSLSEALGEVEDAIGTVSNIDSALQNAACSEKMEDFTANVDEALGWAEALVDELRELKMRMNKS